MKEGIHPAKKKQSPNPLKPLEEQGQKYRPVNPLPNGHYLLVITMDGYDPRLETKAVREPEANMLIEVLKFLTTSGTQKRLVNFTKTLPN